MPRIVQLKPDDADADYLPPAFYLHFTQEEFPNFLADPVGTMEQLGQPVKNLTVTVKDHVWDAGKREWVTEQTGKVLFDLPTAVNWTWLCGYSDEMCVCEKVIAATLE